MTETVVITLLGVPRSKLRPRFGRLRSGAPGTFTDAKTREYEGDLRAAASRAMNGRAPLSGPLELSLQAVFQVPSSWSGKRRRQALAGMIRPTVKPDWNNLGGPLDALNAIVWEDDKQIVGARVLKIYGERPGLEIKVWPALSASQDSIARPAAPELHQVDLEESIASLGEKRCSG